MLASLQRLINNGVFTTSKTQAETELAFLRASDSISAFINETATFNKNLLTAMSEVKEAYNAYCDFYGLDVETEKKLAYKMTDLPHVKHTTKRLEGELKKVWLGVNFKVLAENNDSATENEPSKAKQATLSDNVLPLLPQLPI
jgi:phage/plasmid-associated DNA primase